MLTLPRGLCPSEGKPSLCVKSPPSQSSQCPVMLFESCFILEEARVVKRDSSQGNQQLSWNSAIHFREQSLCSRPGPLTLLHRLSGEWSFGTEISPAPLQKPVAANLLLEAFNVSPQNPLQFLWGKRKGKGEKAASHRVLCNTLTQGPDRLPCICRAPLKAALLQGPCKLSTSRL